MCQAFNGSRSFRRRYGDVAGRGVPRAIPATGSSSTSPAFISRIHFRGRSASPPSRGAGVVAEAGAARLPRLMRLVGLLSGLSDLHLKRSDVNSC